MGPNHLNGQDKDGNADVCSGPRLRSNEEIFERAMRGEGRLLFLVYFPAQSRSFCESTLTQVDGHLLR